MWYLQRGTPGASAEDPVTAAASVPTAEVLAAIPPAKGHSRVDQVIARLSGKVEENDRDANAWADLGDALMQKARETADAGYYTHAERAFAKALALNPKHVTATTGLAWVHGGRHEFEQSVEWATKAVALDPKNHSAHGLLGDAALEMGDYETAREHYQKMIDTRPDLSSYSRGAQVLFLAGDVRKAIWLMGKAIAAGGPYAENTAWCRAQLALMYFHTGNLAAAEQVLQDALTRLPNNHHLLAVQGKVKAARKDYPAAIDCYQEALAVAPQIDVLAALGDLYRLTGQAGEAEKQYALVEAVHRTHKANGVKGDSQLARFWADHDRNLAEALRLAESEYQTRKNVFVADTLAWCLLKNGRCEEAKGVIEKALARKTPDASILFHAGMIHAKLGNRGEAQRYLYQALSLNPHFSPVDAPVAAQVHEELGSKPE
jgi:tetratricopeptide (TPR) repeat protein